MPPSPQELDALINRLRDMIDQAERVVVFTGAGISTESGIPDFRSPGGVWDRYQPIYFQDFMASEEMRRESWRRKIETDKAMAPAEPNRGHRAIEKLARDGKVTSVITQNIDGLHQASGIPDSRVIELHGNATYAHCLECGMRHELDAILKRFARDEILPICASCGSVYVKTATISFGQAMPEDAMRAAERETLDADLFIAAGSSLVVHPANSFPLMAKRNGAAYAILNREATDQDPSADLVIHHELGTILGDSVGVN